MVESGQELSARFVLVRCLGTGGSGSVWLAQDRERGQRVAVKVLADELAHDAAAVAFLRRECEQAGSLEHPNILRVDGLHRSAQHVWIAMEYAAGGDLSQLRGRGCAEILRAVAPVAAALAHAHRAGIIHRDVKPANVLLGADGSPKLADFGIALAAWSPPPPDAGRGSPYSMSPQQRAGAVATPADDIYGFGAMLYELLSGYPPHYQGVVADTAQPADLPASVPPAIGQLVRRLLATEPADRPANMETVERELATALTQLPKSSIMNDASINDAGPGSTVRIEPPSIRQPAGQGETLRGEWRRAGSAGASHDELRRQGFRRGLGASAIVVGIAAAIGVFFVLPRFVASDKPASAPAVAANYKPAGEVVEQSKKEVDFAELARLKQQADDQRVAVDERLKKLSARAVDRWGGEEFTRASDELAAGDKDYAAREYGGALEHFNDMEPLLTTLEKRAGEVLTAQLKAGAAALEQGRSADAKTAFDLAGKIDPKNQVAAAGLKRANTLDEVMGLVANAERLEKEGNANGAIQDFRKALTLDSQAPRAGAGIARIEARLAGDAFASAMARGFGALAIRDYATARSAFDAAGKIRPNAPEIAQALRQIEQEQRTGVISAKLAKAQQHEGQEQWADALKEYRAVVELDSTVAAGKEGVERVTPRATLNEQLELYLTQPERLFSQSVRAAARETLARVAAISNPGPVLQKQAKTLQEWLARADVPVPVALQSDNLTQVTIYRVGELGAFAQRSLDLVPGSYTVVGTRPGYRDVRRQINVIPGTPAEPVIIRCEDRI